MPPLPIDPTTLAMLIAASFTGSFITVAFGIGGGIFLLAVMATLLPPVALIPVHGVVQAASNAGRFALLARNVLWSALPGFTIGSIIGCVAGGLIVVELPPGAIHIAVGPFVIWSVLARPPVWLRRFPAVTGVLSSVLTMFFGATGPFVASYTKSLGVERQGYVATHAALMTVQHSIKVVVFGFLGFAFAEWGIAIALMVAAGFAGTVTGKALLDRMPELTFQRILDVLLILVSLHLIWSGASSLRN